MKSVLGCLTLLLTRRGTLLVNERMLETYIYARKHFLKPGGKMFPSVGRIHVAAFSDEILYGEMVSKAAFWLQVLAVYSMMAPLEEHIVASRLTALSRVGSSWH